MTQRKTLEERVRDRWQKKTGGLRIPDYVRAELDRLARQVRDSRSNLLANKALLCVSSDPRDLLLSERCEGGISALNEVLALLREAKK